MYFRRLKNNANLAGSILLALSATLLSACGGGGTDSSGPMPEAKRRHNSTTTAAPAPTPVTTTPASKKKGVGTWYFSGGDKALADFKGSWFYDWAPDHAWINPPAGIEFLPMIWGVADVTTTKLNAAKASGSSLLLGFNEPDIGSQSNMTVTQALDLWPQLMATGMPLCSPATASNPSPTGNWLDTFMTGVAARNYRVDKICVHWYGDNFDPATATAQLKATLQMAFDKYKKPILLTEFALTNWGAASAAGQYPSASVEAEFVRQATAMLEGLPFVERYAWFSVPKYSSNPAESSYLYNSDGTATLVGQAYRAVTTPTTTSTTTTTSTSPQLLKNPGFESGSLSDWSVWESRAGATYVSATGAMDGQYHAGQRVNGVTQSYLYQSLAVANGQYSASCAMQGKGSKGLYFGVKAFDALNPNTQQGVTVNNTSAYARYLVGPINVTSGRLQLFSWLDSDTAGDYSMVDACEVKRL